MSKSVVNRILVLVAFVFAQSSMAVAAGQKLRISNAMFPECAAFTLLLGIKANKEGNQKMVKGYRRSFVMLTVGAVKLAGYKFNQFSVEQRQHLQRLRKQAGPKFGAIGPLIGKYNVPCGALLRASMNAMKK